MTKDSEHIEYDDTLVNMLELIWGDGFLSPGGPQEVARILKGADISGKDVLDVGCGVGGVDVLLAREHGARSVLGIDIEQPVLDRCVARAKREGLEDRLSYQKVDPGPFPFAAGSFDVVFSKDAMIHIPDKAALFSDVYRVLRPGGLFIASDWMRRDEDPPSAEMLHYLEMEGLSFGMASQRQYRNSLVSAGFHDAVVVDHNAWYRELAHQELDQIRGPLWPRMNELLGAEAASRFERTWHALTVVLDLGEHRPGHLRAIKSV